MDQSICGGLEGSGGGSTLQVKVCTQNCHPPTTQYEPSVMDEPNLLDTPATLGALKDLCGLQSGENPGTEGGSTERVI